MMRIYPNEQDVERVANRVLKIHKGLRACQRRWWTWRRLSGGGQQAGDAKQKERNLGPGPKLCYIPALL